VVFNVINNRYKPGLRAVKTALAVFICLLVSFLLKRPDGFFASISAVICMRQTHNKTFDTGSNRLIGTIIGGAVGYIVMVFLQNTETTDKAFVNMLLGPCCVLFIIYLCNLIDHKTSVEISCIVMLSIIAHRERVCADSWQALFYVVYRILDTSLGIVVAMLVNRWIFPFKEPPKQE
jgi:uncharacterized membrane protein YgaE (UPF0421/DUF939 family)